MSVPSTGPPLQKLGDVGDLPDRERQLLGRIAKPIRAYGVRQNIIREGDRPAYLWHVIEGFVCRYKLLPEGKRLITAFHVPGDLVGVNSFILGRAGDNVRTLAPTKVVPIPHQELREVTRNAPHITDALWRATVVDAARLTEWMARIGRSSARARMAHLLCELLLRLQAVGLADHNQCALPMTQAELADGLGISTVHANRILQDLRFDRLITLKAGELTIEDWDSLAQEGGFDATYLHLEAGT